MIRQQTQATPTPVHIQACLANLRGNQAIEAIEIAESELKASIRKLLTFGSGSAERALAGHALCQVGLIPKVKSYAIKAAHPTGYSVFLQEPGSGFSFQLHPNSKVELVHILLPRGNSKVFKMPYPRWTQVVDDERMSRWLGGAHDEELEGFAVEPRAGDIFTVETTSDVHTVLGCYLEEFATNSSDLVQRLYDQNAERPTPQHFSLAHMQRELDALPDVTPQRKWELTPTGWIHRPISPHETSDALHWRIPCGPLTASWLRIKPGHEWSLECGPDNVLFARVSAGSGRVTRRNSPSVPIDVRQGMSFVLLAHEKALIKASRPDSLALSIHETPLALALFA